MSSQRQRTLIVAGVLAVVAASVGMLLVASDRLGEGLSGPVKLSRAADDTLWVASHGHLHQLGRSGERLQKIALADLGIEALVSGVAAAGDDRLFIGQAEPSKLFRCAMAQKKCIDLSSAVATTAGPTRHALMLAADAATGRLVVSDNAAHRVLLTDFDGNVLAQSRRYQFRFPNQPSWLAADAIALADTNHHRIVTLGIDGARIATERSQFAVKGNPPGRPGRFWPMDAQRASDGSWWVLSAQDGMRNADLLRFDDGGRLLTREDLGAASDPTAIALLGNDVIVAEPLRATLIRVAAAADGFTREPFGDAAFQRELASLRSDRSFWSAARVVAQGLMVLAPVVAIFLLWRMGEPVSAKVPGVARPEGVEPRAVAGEHWVATGPRFAWGGSGRWLWVAHLVLCLVLTGVLLFAGALEWFGPSGSGPGLLLAFFGVAMGLIMLLDLYMIVRGPAAWRMRLGTDGEVLLLRRGSDTAPERFAFRSLATYGRALLVGRHVVQLSTRRGPRFDHDELAAYVLARMPKSAFVSAPEFLRRALQNGNRLLWLTLIVIGIIAGLELLSLFFPGLTTAWRSAVTRGLAWMLGFRR